MKSNDNLVNIFFWLISYRVKICFNSSSNNNNSTDKTHNGPNLPNIVILFHLTPEEDFYSSSEHQTYFSCTLLFYYAYAKRYYYPEMGKLR